MYKRSDASAKLKPAPNVSGTDLAGSDIKEASPTGMTALPSMARKIARRSIAVIGLLSTKTSQSYTPRSTTLAANAAISYA